MSNGPAGTCTPNSSTNTVSGEGIPITISAVPTAHRRRVPDSSTNMNDSDRALDGGESVSSYYDDAQATTTPINFSYAHLHNHFRHHHTAAVAALQRHPLWMRYIPFRKRAIESCASCVEDSVSNLCDALHSWKSRKNIIRWFFALMVLILVSVIFMFVSNHVEFHGNPARFLHQVRNDWSTTFHNLQSEDNNLVIKTQISAQNMLQSYNCTNTIGNYTQDSIFHSILMQLILLSTITDNRDHVGSSFSRTMGRGVDRVSAMALCGGSIVCESCDKCIKDAANNLTKLYCPVQKEAIVFSNDCMFRYSNKDFIGNMSLTPFYMQKNSTVIAPANAYVFSQNLTSLADLLVFRASTPEKLFIYKYRAEDVFNNPNGGETIYGYMECTPDISSIDCRTCLNHTKHELLSCCSNVVGAMYRTPSCSFRFEMYNFHYYYSDYRRFRRFAYEKKSTRVYTGKKIIIVVCSTVVALLVVSLCVYITRRSRLKENTGHEGQEEEEEELLKSLRTETTQYNLVEIRDATEEFSMANKLGRGGFGEVYKGVLSDGKEIAVKRLSTTSGQGKKEFENEVLLLAKLQHTCLVKLLGFCLEKKERLLVYEFMANGSLDKVLFDQENRSRLDWEGRYSIIKSITRGLLYLHEDSRLLIIHRDLKTGNILLDGDMNAKISDFGMARLFDRDEGEVITKRIAGTLGYMAPEYAMHGLFSVKSDVYSYGVLLLEIVSGKRIYYSLTEDTSEGLVSYAYKAWKEGKASDLIDPMLTADSDSLENMIRCIHIALLCVQDNVGSRPTMSSVNLMLQSTTITLPIPLEPGFFNTITRSWLSELLESNARNDPPLNEETDSYLYPR